MIIFQNVPSQEQVKIGPILDSEGMSAFLRAHFSKKRALKRGEVNNGHLKIVNVIY